MLSQTSELKGGKSPTLGMPYSGPIERTRFLRGPGTRCCVVARQAG